MAINALLANKMRSLLTMLGVIIGVAAVIALVSVGMGVRTGITSNFESLGANTITIMPGSSNRGGPRGAAGSMQTLKYDDAKAIEAKIKDIQYVSPTVSSSYQVVNGNQNWNTSVTGVTPDLMQIRSLTVDNGSFISKEDMTKRNRVAVIGATVAENLFGTENPVGKNIRIKNQPFKVIGILASKGSSGFGQDQDDVIYIPLTTAQERMMGITYVQSISLQATDTQKIEQVQDEITTLLRQRHRITGDKEDDFHVQNTASIIASVNQSTAMMTVLLGAIASISLLVGGIGIMNIMMVSVTERTREIGIRKALGATFQNIMMQFMIESMVLGIVGGLIGIVVGCVASYVISSTGAVQTTITLLPIVLSFSFAVGIGLFFGIYPARKAARLAPNRGTALRVMKRNIWTPKSLARLCEAFRMPV